MSATILSTRLASKLGDLKKAKSEQNDQGIPKTLEEYRYNVGYIRALEDCNKFLQALLSEINGSN
jgi:hypothetical protein